MMKQFYKTSHSNDLVSKSTAMIINKLNFKNIIMKLFNKSNKTKCKVFQNKNIYAPFSSNQELNLYYQNLNINIKTLYDCLFDTEELTMYEILQKMNMFYMFDLNKNDFTVLNKLLK